MRVESGTWTPLVFAGVCLIACCYGLARFAYGLFLPDFTTEFDLSPTMSGVIGSGSYAGYCIAVVASTIATARLGARPVAVAAGVLATAGILTVAAAPNAIVLAIGILVAGSSTGIASPPLAAAVALAVRERSRDAAQTIVNAGTGIGVLVSGPLAVLLLGQWRIAWLIFAVIAAVVTTWIWRTVPGGRAVPTSAAAAAHPSSSHPSSGRRAMALLVVAALVMGVGSIAVWTFGRRVVLEAGSPEWVAPVLWTAIGAAGIAGAAAGAMVRRLGLRRSWTLGMLALAIGGAGLAATAGVPALAIACGAVFGGAYIALTGVLLVWATRLHPARPATGVGIAFLALAAGQGLGGPLAGWASEAVPLPWVFVGCAVVTVLGAVLGPARIDPPETRRAESSSTC